MDTWDYVILAFEFVYYIFVAYYIVEEVLEIIKIGKYRYSNSSFLFSMSCIFKVGATFLVSGTIWTSWC